MIDEFNSSSWLPDIRLMALGMYNELKRLPTKDSTSINMSNIGQINRIYEENLPALKKEMRSGIHGDLIDRHKISALYIKCILEAHVFEVLDSGNFKTALLAKIPNEMFAWQVMVTIIESFKRGKGREFKIRYADSIYCDETKSHSSYRDHFFRMLYSFRKSPMDIPVFPLAHIIFHLEMATECCFYGNIKSFFTLD